MLRGVEGVLGFWGLTLCGVVVLHSWLVVMRSCLLSVGGGGGGRFGHGVVDEEEERLEFDVPGYCIWIFRSDHGTFMSSRGQRKT